MSIGHAIGKAINAYYGGYFAAKGAAKAREEMAARKRAADARASHSRGTAPSVGMSDIQEAFSIERRAMQKADAAFHAYCDATGRSDREKARAEWEKANAEWKAISDKLNSGELRDDVRRARLARQKALEEKQKVQTVTKEQPASDEWKKMWTVIVCIALAILAVILVVCIAHRPTSYTPARTQNASYSSSATSYSSPDYGLHA